MMKTGLQYILFSFLGIGLISCEDDDPMASNESPDGIEMQIEFTSEEASYINYNELEESSISYTITSSNKNIDRVDIYLEYVNVFTDLSNEEIKFETLSQIDFNSNNGVITKVYTADQLAKAVGKNSFQDLNPGDFFMFRQQTELTNGNMYPPDTVSDFSNKVIGIFTTSFVAFVGCPPLLIPGTYLGSPTNEAVPCSNDPFGQADKVKVDYEVSVTRTGYLSYLFSDITGGYYADFLFSDFEPHEFFDICNYLVSIAAKGELSIIAKGEHRPSIETIDIIWMDSVNVGITCENSYIYQN